MVTIELKRNKQTKVSTIGELFVDGKFVCYVLEDGHNEPKIYGESRIPAGTYPVTLRREGKFFQIYSKIYKKSHPMLWIRNIPGFEYVLIHKGNTILDTLGCLLVGKKYFYQKDPNPNDGIDTAQYKILGGTSTPAYDEMYTLVAPRMEAGEECRIIITESF